MHSSCLDGRGACAHAHPIGRRSLVAPRRHRPRSATSPSPAPPPSSIPQGFYALFVAQACERFSHYLLLSLLLLFLNEHLRFSQSAAPVIVGMLTGAIYLSSFVGGLIADRRLGYRRAVLAGSLLATVGYFVLAVDSRAALVLALLLLCIGQGLFKPSLQAAVSSLYQPDDPLRANGFSRIYLATNIGGLLGPLMGGLIHQALGWRPAFLLAGVVMLSGMAATYGASHVSHAEHDSARALTAPEQPEEREREWDVIRTLLILFGLLTLSGSVLCQYTSVLLFWVRDHVDRTVVGWDIPAAAFTAMPASLVLVLLPLVERLFRGLRARRFEPQPTAAGLTVGQAERLRRAAMVVHPLREPWCAPPAPDRSPRRLSM